MFQTILRAIWALFISIFALSGAGSLASAQDAATVTALRAGLEKMRAGDWGEALKAAGDEGTVARDIILWHALRASKGSFAQAQSFLARHGDWPGLTYLRKRSEVTIPRNADPGQVVAFFTEEPPQTGTGALRLASALTANGKEVAAVAQAVLAWFSLSLTRAEEEALLAAYGDELKPYHWQRLDMLLWSNSESQARRMIARVDTGHRALAEARLALRDQSKGVDTLIEAIPAALADDPGLAYERFVWRARKGREDAAIELALARSTSATTLGQPQYWSDRRRTLARRLMRDNRNDEAYRLAAQHHLSGGSNHNDLEWLAGFIALRKLEDPARALKHFQTFRDHVDTPISLGRAGYWEGRAHEALGNPDAAQAAYAFGAGYQSSFYGQLAAEKAGVAMNPTLTGREPFPDWQGAAFWNGSVMQAVRLLEAADELHLATRFATHLAESLTRTEAGQLAAWAASKNSGYMQVKIAKRAARQGIVLDAAYYPLPEFDLAKGDVPQELALSIARRESEFHPEVVSGAGARGLMQLMPNTARDMTKRLNIGYSAGRLTSDPAYNVQLGTAYLAYLTEGFGPNPVLLSVAYNAGPGRARSWSARFGDPRSRSVDVVDWIEHIPFRETRNYVMRVTESLPVYRARLSGETAPLRLSEELQTR